jgi:hypothetical protein
MNISAAKRLSIRGYASVSAFSPSDSDMKKKVSTIMIPAYHNNFNPQYACRVSAAVNENIAYSN